jgi:hypothetical protein
VSAAARSHQSWNAARAAVTGGSTWPPAGGVAAHVPAPEGGDVQVLEAEDRTYHSTPQGWAAHPGRPRLEALLREAAAARR